MAKICSVSVANWAKKFFSSIYTPPNHCIGTTCLTPGIFSISWRYAIGSIFVSETAWRTNNRSWASRLSGVRLRAVQNAKIVVSRKRAIARLKTVNTLRILLRMAFFQIRRRYDICYHPRFIKGERAADALGEIID